LHHTQKNTGAHKKTHAREAMTAADTPGPDRSWRVLKGVGANADEPPINSKRASEYLVSSNIGKRKKERRKEEAVAKGLGRISTAKVRPKTWEAAISVHAREGECGVCDG